MPLTGKYATYSGGGYVLQIASDPSLQAGRSVMPTFHVLREKIVL